MKIYTDNKWKQFKYRYEVPKCILKTEFDYQDPEEATDGFFQYKRAWYHLDMFMRMPNNAPKELKKWDGYLNDSAFSGVLIKVSNDSEEYKIATFIT